MILNIEGATDHSCLKKRSWSKSKVIIIAIECYIVQKAKPVAPLSITESYGYFGYPYACIYQLIIEDFFVQIHHGHFHFFVTRFFLSNFGFTVVIQVLPGSLKTLKNGFFLWQMSTQSIKNWPLTDDGNRESRHN